MIPVQGFSPGRLGRRTRSLGKGGRRGGASFVLPPLGGMVLGRWEVEVLLVMHWGGGRLRAWLDDGFRRRRVGSRRCFVPSR